MRADSVRNNNRILYSDQTRCQEHFTGSNTPPAVAKIFDDTNAICLR